MNLRLRLVATLGITLVLVWSVTAAWSLRELSTQLEESLDQRLAQSARMVSGLLDRVPATYWNGEEDGTSDIPSLEGIACRVSSLRGQVVAGTHPEMNDVLAIEDEGYRYREYKGQRWRVYTLVDNGKRITVADRLKEREALLQQVRRAALYPFLLALVGSLVALWWGVTSGLAPLAMLQRRLMSRDHDDLSALPIGGLPAEIRPLIDSFNTLLARTRRMLELEQRFTDDAAHELRTPLTAVRTHLQIARRVDGHRQYEAMQQAEAGVDRLTKTLGQLLLLARMESEDITRSRYPDSTSFGDALVTAMTETGSCDHCHYPQGVNQVHIALSESLLVTVLRNLLENAMRHGTFGAPIEVSVQESKGMAVIDITSQGETIASEHLSRLTERFHRGDHPKGSGLGLSIVEAIITRAGGRMTFLSGKGVGLKVTLYLPAA